MGLSNKSMTNCNSRLSELGTLPVSGTPTVDTRPGFYVENPAIGHARALNDNSDRAQFKQVTRSGIKNKPLGEWKNLRRWMCTHKVTLLEQKDEDNHASALTVIIRTSAPRFRIRFTFKVRKDIPSNLISKARSSQDHRHNQLITLSGISTFAPFSKL